MTKMKNSAEITATLLEIFGTFQAVADALGASVSQVHAWSKETEMSRSTERLARRIMDAYAYRSAMLKSFLVWTFSPSRTDPVMIIVDVTTIDDSGMVRHKARTSVSVETINLGKYIDQLVADLHGHEAAPDPWNSNPSAVHFFKRDEDTQKIEVVSIFTDADAGDPASKNMMAALGAVNAPSPAEMPKRR